MAFEDYDVKLAFARIENELIASMMRNLKRHLKEEEEEGFDWSQWQVEQLKYLQEYRRRNQKEYGPRFKSINERIEEAIRFAHENGQKDEELNILDAISKDKRIRPRYQNPSQASIEGAGDAFFRVNDRKLEALVEATHSDLEKAEQAVLRRTNDQYRKIIFDAQMYANTGAGTIEKAVDMATKDFLSKGIDSIQYKNGARHTISDYADMYIRTAERRAYLMGEGKKRQEWGESLVIVNRRGTMTNGNYGHACPQCIPWLGKILIDDVYSGGKPDGKHELLSDAMAQGFLHPRCRDGFTTYFPGISPQEDPVTKQEAKKAVETEKAENRFQYAERQQERYERLAEYSLDPENRRTYEIRANRWQEEAIKYHFKANDSEDVLVRMGYERREEQMLSISSDRELQKLFKSARNKDGGMPKAFSDLTSDWKNSINRNTPSVINNAKQVVLDGITYHINGIGIKLDFSPFEEDMARLISAATGKTATMMPKFAGKNINISSPDFVLDETEKWDVKELCGASKDAIRNAISKKKRQADHFVVDITNYQLGDDSALEQTELVFRAHNTSFVQTLVIVKDKEILRALIRR